MNTYKKSINTTKGFTLLEVLLALFTVSIAILLFVNCIQILSKLTKETYWNEDALAIQQMRIELAQSENIHYLPQELQFDKAKTSYTYRLHTHRLVKQKGYEIYLKDIDDVSFTQEGGCIHVTWYRKNKRHKAALWCE